MFTSYQVQDSDPWPEATKINVNALIATLRQLVCQSSMDSLVVRWAVRLDERSAPNGTCTRALQPPRAHGVDLKRFLTTHFLQWMSFLLTNSRMPNCDSSRPYPEFLMPPKGSSACERVGWLMYIIPVSTRSATRRPRSMSRV